MFDKARYHPELEIPISKSVQVEDLIKILYLNNKDPYKYTMKFWASFFDVDIEMLRNVLNFMAYPVYTLKNPDEISEIYTFKDVDPLKKHKLIGEMNEEEYFEYSTWLKQQEIEELPYLQKAFNILYDKDRMYAEDPVLQLAEDVLKKLPTSNK